MTARPTGTELESRRDDRTAAMVDRVRMEAAADYREPFFLVLAILLVAKATIGFIGGGTGDIVAGVLTGLYLMVMAGFIIALRKLDALCRSEITRGAVESVFELAQRRRGVLTVTAVAAEPYLGLTLDEAEHLLIDLDDGSAVRSEISDEGVIYYEFTEFLDREESAPA